MRTSSTELCSPPSSPPPSPSLSPPPPRTENTPLIDKKVERKGRAPAAQSIGLDACMQAPVSSTSDLTPPVHSGRCAWWLRKRPNTDDSGAASPTAHRMMRRRTRMLPGMVCWLRPGPFSRRCPSPLPPLLKWRKKVAEKLKIFLQERIKPPHPPNPALPNKRPTKAGRS